MNIAITGNEGYMGHALTTVLAASGHEVIWMVIVPAVLSKPFKIYCHEQNAQITNIIRLCKSGSIKLKDSRPMLDFIYISGVIAHL